MSTPTAFYCVSDERYFLGAVGLVNSLRLVGHTEPVYLLDCGLTEAHRELISPHVTLVEGDRSTPPWLLKTIAPLSHPADVMVLIDADMIVTRSLSELIARAREGKLAAAINDRDHFRPEWGELLELGELRRGPYLSSGLVVTGRELGTRVLGLMDSLQDRVDFDQTFWRQDRRQYPFRFGDQDVLNAILASDRIPPDSVLALEHRLAPTPPYRGLRIVDLETLRCSYADGARPYLVHQYIRKPWLDPLYHGAYSRLLVRLLVEPDVAVRVPGEALPLRLRRGPRARLHRALTSVRDAPRWHLADPIIDLVPERLKDRVDPLRRRSSRVAHRK